MKPWRISLFRITQRSQKQMERGLGIPIVRRIVAEHGAEIDFQSTEGVGTTVRIRFSDDPSERSEELTPGPEELTPLIGLGPKLETEERSIDTQE